MITIRKAQPADTAAIAQHNQLMAMETENKRLDEDTVMKGVAAAFTDSSKGFYLVAEMNGATAGSLMITYEWSDWRNVNVWWIQSVYIRKEYRRNGIYRALYEKVKEMARAENVKIIRLYVEKENETAQQTYEALGMKHSYYLLYDAEL